MSARLRLLAPVLFVSCLSLAAMAQSSSQRSAAELMDAVMWNREPIGGPFELVDQHDARRTDADFRGKLMLIYFGFSYCPDVCPTDLQQIGLALDRLGGASEAVQPVFITLDPERDTPEHLKDYMPLFHPRFVGLTGNASAIAAAASAYRVYYKKIEFGDRSDYTVDHSAFVYLIGRDGKYIGFFPPGTPADRLAETLRAHLAAER